MTRTELCELPDLITEVRRRKEGIEVLEGIAEGGSQATDSERVQSSARDRTEILAVIIDLKTELKPLEDHLIRTQDAAKELLTSKLKGRDLRLMRLRYIVGLKWHQVAKAMRYNTNYVQELNMRILDRLFA